MSLEQANFGLLCLTDKSNMSGLTGHFPDTIFLKLGRQIIGRSNKADIKLSAEKEGKFIISRSHAAIIVQGESCTAEIEDLGALNGIFVNDVRVKSSYLKDGDILQFGGMSEVPVGKRLTGGDAAVRYVFHCGSTKDKQQQDPISREISPTSISGNKRVSCSNGSKEKRVKLSEPMISPASCEKNEANNPCHESASSVLMEKSLTTPVSSQSKVNSNRSINNKTSSASCDRVEDNEINANVAHNSCDLTNNNNKNIINSNNSNNNNTMTLRIPANSFVLSPQATQELQHLRETQERHTVLLQQLLTTKTQPDTSVKENIMDRDDTVLTCLQDLKSQLNDKFNEIKEVQSKHEMILADYNFTNRKDADDSIMAAINHLTKLVTHQLQQNKQQLLSNVTNDTFRNTVLAQVKCVLCRKIGVDLCVLRCSHSVCALCLAAYLCPEEPALKSYTTHIQTTHTNGNTAKKEDYVSQLACPACDIPLLPALPENTSLCSVKMPVAFRSASLDEIVFSLCCDTELKARYDTCRASLHYLFYPKGSDNASMVSQITRDTLMSFMPLPELLDTVSHMKEEHGQCELKQTMKRPLDTQENNRDTSVSSDEQMHHHKEELDDTDHIVSCDYCGETGHSVADCPHNNSKYYNDEEVEEEVLREKDDDDDTRRDTDEEEEQDI